MGSGRADRQGALDNVNLFASAASASRARFRHPRLFVVHARQGSDSIWLFDWLCASSCAKAVALAVCRPWGFSESVMGTVPAMRGAAASYNVDYAVLDRIGQLSSTKGGSGARKREGVETPLADDERRFLERATVRSIRRLAEHHAAKGGLPTISMGEFS